MVVVGLSVGACVGNGSVVAGADACDTVVARVGIDGVGAVNTAVAWVGTNAVGAVDSAVTWEGEGDWGTWCDGAGIGFGGICGGTGDPVIEIVIVVVDRGGEWPPFLVI